MLPQRTPEQTGPNHDEFLGALHNYVVEELLDGNAEGLDAQTPLLQWGVID